MDQSVVSALAGGLIATATFRVLIERGILKPEDGTAIIERAIDAVRHSTSPNELGALDLLRDLHRQLHT